MPTISIFFGIFIKMYCDDHFPPHFHAEYNGLEAQIAIEDGRIMRGNLPPRAVRLIEEWRQMHISELMQNWERARMLQLPEKIEPLE